MLASPTLPPPQQSLFNKQRAAGEMPLSALRFPPPGSSALHSSATGAGVASLHLPTLATTLRRGPCIARTATNAPPSAFSLLQEFHLTENEAKALLLRHPELDLASPESVRGRLLVLQSLGLPDPVLRRSLVCRPDILSAPEFEPFIEFVRDELKGLSPGKMERLLVTTPPELFNGITEKTTLLVDHGIAGEKLAHVFKPVNVKKLFYERPLRDLEETILFLKGFGWPDVVLRRPMILNLGLHDQLIPRVEFLTEFSGGDEAATARLIAKLPGLLSYTVEHFKSQLEFWRSVGLADEQLFKIVLVYPGILTVGKERKLEPRVEFLRQCGMSAEDIFRFLVKAPLFMSLSFEKNLSKKLAFLVKLGYKHRTRELAVAFGATTRTSCGNMQGVIGLFLSYGLSFEEILAMSKKHHQVLQYNHKSLEKKMEFLVEGMGRDVGSILGFPAFLGYKLEERIKKRYEMKRGSRGAGMSLNKLLSVSSDKFYRRNDSEL